MVLGAGMAEASEARLAADFAPVGEDSDAKDGMDPASDLSLEFVRAGFSGVAPCFKKACIKSDGQNKVSSVLFG